MYHIIDSKQFSRGQIMKLMQDTHNIKNNITKYNSVLSDKTIATLFYEPSTRTRLSFEAGILKLGGKNISTENASKMSSAIKGESLIDTIRVIQGYCDAIILRHPDKNAVIEAVNVSKVPIINAGCGSGEHPTQALLDVYTIFNYKHKIDGLSIAILGDLLFGRTIHSLVKLLSLFENITIYGFSREILSLPNEYIKYLEEKNVNYITCKEFNDIPNSVDVIYHTRTQNERFETDIKIEEIIIDSNIMGHFTENTILMHPLPRTNEISQEIDLDKRAIYFDQAHNGMYVRMALLYNILCL